MSRIKNDICLYYTNLKQTKMANYLPFFGELHVAHIFLSIKNPRPGLEEHGKEYFEKVGGNETSWVLPEGAELEGLPKGWKRRVSALDGAHFYYHNDSRRSAWTVSDVQAFEASAEGTRSA